MEIQSIVCIVCKAKPSRTRGVCPNCYRKQIAAIKDGATTDAELVKKGLRKPNRRHECSNLLWRHLHPRRGERDD